MTFRLQVGLLVDLGRLLAGNGEITLELPVPLVRRGGERQSIRPGAQGFLAVNTVIKVGVWGHTHVGLSPLDQHL